MIEECLFKQTLFCDGMYILLYMSSTILEKTRALHEDIERYEQAIEHELESPAKTVCRINTSIYLLAKSKITTTTKYQ